VRGWLSASVWSWWIWSLARGSTKDKGRRTKEEWSSTGKQVCPCHLSKSGDFGYWSLVGQFPEDCCTVFLGERFGIVGRHFAIEDRADGAQAVLRRNRRKVNE